MVIHSIIICMYSLSFFNQTNLLERFSPEQFYGIYHIRANASTRVMICMRYASELIGYEYLPNTASWTPSWRATVFSKDKHSPTTLYPWLVTDILDTGSDQIILRNQQGIRFYQLDGKAPTIFLRLLAEDGRFHNINGWNQPNSTILWGRFYPNNFLLGIMSRNQHGVIKFYAAKKESILANQPYHLWELQRNLTLTPVWHSSRTSLFLTKLQHHGQEAFVLRTDTGLEFYQFNDKYLLQQVTHTSHIGQSGQKAAERLLFGNLTNQTYQDIIHLNNSGLFIYQYNSSQQDYLPIYYSAEFTQVYGWLAQYSNSIQLVDINSDGRDDLLFTGVHGLTALTLDPTIPTWQQLLDSGTLSDAQRYATVIATLPAVPPTISHPLLFTQDTEGRLQSAQIIQSSNVVASPQGSNRIVMLKEEAFAQDKLTYSKLNRKKRATDIEVCSNSPAKKLKTEGITLPPRAIPSYIQGKYEKLIVKVDNNKVTLELGDNSYNFEEVVDSIRSHEKPGDYTPIDREYSTLDLSTEEKIRKHFEAAGVEIKEKIKIKNSNKKAEPQNVIMYAFKQDNRKHRTAIATLIAYNKKHKRKIMYYIKVEQSALIKGDQGEIIEGVIRVSSIGRAGNDAEFMPSKKGGAGTELNPYMFNKGLSYKDMNKAINNPEDQNHEAAKRLIRSMNIVERGRVDIGGIVMVIDRINGMQSLDFNNNCIGGTDAMRILNREEPKIKAGQGGDCGKYSGYSTKVKNHPDGDTIGKIFAKQLAAFITKEKPEGINPNIKDSKELGEEINKILAKARSTGRHSKQQDPSIRKRRALMPYVNQLELPDNEQPEKLVSNALDVHPAAATSGSNSLQFWPINLAKKVGAKIFSLLPTSWTSSTQALPTSEVPNCFSQPQPLITQQIPSTKTGQTVLEMGDYLVNNIDMTGNLTWAVLLARKWTGYRQAVANLPSDYGKASIALDIRANSLVHEFIDAVLSHALACGIITPVRRIINDNSVIQSATQIVRKKLASNQLEAIPQLLCQQLVKQHIDQIAFISTQKQANKLLDKVTKDVPKLQQKLLQQEQEWLLRNECTKETVSFQPLGNRERANINMLTQALASMQQLEGISQNYPLMPTTTTRITTTNMTSPEVRSFL